MTTPLEQASVSDNPKVHVGDFRPGLYVYNHPALPQKQRRHILFTAWKNYHRVPLLQPLGPGFMAKESVDVVHRF